MTVRSRPGNGLCAAMCALFVALIAAILWSVHLWAIRADGRLGGEVPAAPAAAVVPDREALVRRIDQLETELAQARAALAELDRVTR